MEFRLFFQTGLLSKMKKKMKIIIVVPNESIKGVKKIVGKQILVEGSTIGKLTVLDEHKEKGLNAFVSRILAFVYSEKRNKMSNITPKIHFESIKKIAKKKKITSIFVVYLIIFFCHFGFKILYFKEAFTKVIRTNF